MLASIKSPASPEKLFRQDVSVVAANMVQHAPDIWEVAQSVLLLSESLALICQQPG